MRTQDRRPPDLGDALQRAALAATTPVDATLRPPLWAETAGGDHEPEGLAEPPRVAIRDGSGDLTVTTLLGEGGMGRVFAAEQRSLGREVAVKVLRAGVADAAQAGALLAEARAMGKVDHPNVVPIHALGTDERGMPAVIMKRVEGVSWRELLADAAHPAWTWLQAGWSDRLLGNLQVLMQVCNALEAAHDARVVHRDVKPANVIVGRFGEVYLADWGVALLLDAPLPQGIVGTPAYMAPEMLTGDPSLADARTDVFLLGATLHEVLVGSPRHPGATLHEVFAQAADVQPHAYDASIPDALAAICNRATSADPSARYASVGAFRAALAEYLRHRGSVALSDGARERLAVLGERLAAPEASAESVQTLGAECRFGFLQALREWPENEDAREGLRTCLESLAAFEIERSSPAAARAWLADLPDPSPPLVVRLEAAQRELSKREEQRARLEQDARERDLLGSFRRVAKISGVWLAWSVLAGTVVFSRPAERIFGEGPAYSRGIANHLLQYALPALVVFLARDRLLLRLAERQFFALYALTGLGSLFLYVLGAIAHVPIPALASLLPTSICVVGFAVAIAYQRWLLPPAIAATLVALVGAVVAPGQGVILSAVVSNVYVVVLAVVAWLEVRARARAAAPPPA